jgi:hypothetical protein
MIVIAPELTRPTAMAHYVFAFIRRDGLSSLIDLRRCSGTQLMLSSAA